MAVPNTTTFTLQNVVDEINPTTDDLVDCISDATASSYDPTYYTSPATSLYEFRNYGAACNTTTSLNIGGIPYGSNASACGGTYSETAKYFVGGNSDVVNGDYVYTDAGGCSAFNGGSNYYKVRSNVSGFFTIRVSSLGLVSNKTAC